MTVLSGAYSSSREISLDRADLIRELVAANRILSAEGVVDAFGHVSARLPENPQRFLLSRARAPECIEAEDILEFELDGTPIDAGDRKPYMERFIHGAIYEARPDVHSVVHNHSHAVIPFAVAGKKLRPLMHVCSVIGSDVPVWDSGDEFGDTDLLVSAIEMGRSLARTLGDKRAVLMRGHGATVVGNSVRDAVYASVYLQVNANLQFKAVMLANGDPIKFLTPGEVDIRAKKDGAFGIDRVALGIDRAWESWCRHAGL
jgi:ribulose-5-phosphate 4-epimerase/fuculose-1-phosphate aldolase